ncbi:MAG TPA: hypothetical protein VHK69_16715 [Chitinophagaceae bacterium]|jgi:hypothetical protein|nr:hypothetical protein [Chitinophagaceae bacterium]
MNTSEHLFTLKGDNGLLQLKIAEVEGFPHTTSCFGGYDTRSVLQLTAGIFSVQSSLYLSTGALYRFLQELEKSHRTLSGQAHLNSDEGDLQLTLTFDRQGHVMVAGTFTENNGLCSNELRFELSTDQTFISETLHGLRAIAAAFGDEQGKSTS